MKKLLPLVLVVSFFVFALPVRAFTTRTEKDAELRVTQPINDTAFLVGSSIVVDAPITGDLLCMAQTVTINAPVSGDVLCAAQSVTVNNSVNGIIRCLSQNMMLNGMVGRNVMSLAQQLTMSDKGTVSGELTSWAQSMMLDGTIQHGVMGGGEHVTLNGRVNGPVNVQVSSLTVGKTASIGGDLTYTGKQEAIVEPGSSIMGMVQRREPKQETRTESKRTPEGFLSKLIKGIIIHAFIGTIVLYFFSTFAQKVVTQLNGDGVQNVIKGVLVVVVTPVVLILIALTIIGIPITILGFIVWGFLLVISQTLVSLAVGQKVMEQQLTKKSSLYLPMLTGVIIVQFVVSIPFVGGLISLVATAVGSGAVTTVLLNRKNR